MNSLSLATYLLMQFEQQIVYIYQAGVKNNSRVTFER